MLSHGSPPALCFRQGTVVDLQWEDTDPATEKAYIKLLRATTPARRAELAVNLSRAAFVLSYSNLVRRHPGASEFELFLLFVELHYGRELAEAVRLQRRGRTHASG